MTISALSTGTERSSHLRSQMHRAAASRRHTLLTGLVAVTEKPWLDCISAAGLTRAHAPGRGGPPPGHAARGHGRARQHRRAGCRVQARCAPSPRLPAPHRAAGEGHTVATAIATAEAGGGEGRCRANHEPCATGSGSPVARRRGVTARTRPDAGSAARWLAAEGHRGTGALDYLLQPRSAGAARKRGVLRCRGGACAGRL